MNWRKIKKRLKREPIILLTCLVAVGEAIAGLADMPVWVYVVVAIFGAIGRQFVTPV